MNFMRQKPDQFNTLVTGLFSQELPGFCQNLLFDAAFEQESSQWVLKVDLDLLGLHFHAAADGHAENTETKCAGVAGPRIFDVGNQCAGILTRGIGKF